MPAKVPFVSVSFGKDRAEEMAYRDGKFVRPYLGSTRVGDTFTLRRMNGWPASPTPHVEEASAAPTTLWTTLYEIDLTALSTQTITANGNAYGTLSLAGRTWSFHTSGCDNDIQIVAGTGLRMISRGHQQTGVNPYGGGRASLIVDLLPGYDPAKQIAVQARFRRPMITDTPKLESFLGTQIWMDGGAPGWGYGPGNNGCCSYMQSQPGVGNGARHIPGQLNWRTNEHGRRYAGGWAQTCYASASVVHVNRFLQDSYSFCGGAPLTAFPSMEDMDPILSTDGGGAVTGGVHAGAYFGGTGSNESDGYATHLRILQKVETSR